MSVHCGQVWYAVCDAADDDGHQCPAYHLATGPWADPGGPGCVFVARAEARWAAEAAGWQVTNPAEARWRVVCPRHAAPKRPTEVVDVPLFDLATSEVSR